MVITLEYNMNRYHPYENIDENIRFIEYLNIYKNCDTVSTSEFGRIKNVIDCDFNRFLNPTLTNNRPFYRPNFETVFYNPIMTNNRPFYSPIPNMEFYNHNLKKIDTNMSSSNTSYISPNITCHLPSIHSIVSDYVKPDTTPIPIVKIHTVNITTKVNSFSDLIEIIDNNEYCDNTEYNIDLESLHKIRLELVDMNNMVGMKDLKVSILDQMMYFMQKLHEGSTPDFKHTVIYGNPGTGKTEVAQIIGRMYSKLGILSKNVFKKVSRSDLIAGYIGQTAIKTRDVVNECLGGCLFIDEVYSLGCRGNSPDIFSKECIDTLCECLSEHRDNLMVIIAGYEEEINDGFFSVNRGLESRFIWRFETVNYTYIELMQIFMIKIDSNGWSILCDTLELWFEKKKNNFKFLGRDMEMLFSYTKVAHGKRVYGMSPDNRKIITLEDLDAGFLIFSKNSANSGENVEKYLGLYV